jgi:hypothetical protein
MFFPLGLSGLARLGCQLPGLKRAQSSELLQQQKALRPKK